MFCAFYYEIRFFFSLLKNPGPDFLSWVTTHTLECIYFGVWIQFGWNRCNYYYYSHYYHFYWHNTRYKNDSNSHIIGICGANFFSFSHFYKSYNTFVSWACVRLDERECVSLSLGLVVWLLALFKIAMESNASQCCMKRKRETKWLFGSRHWMTLFLHYVNCRVECEYKTNHAHNRKWET